MEYNGAYTMTYEAGMEISVQITWRDEDYKIDIPVNIENMILWSGISDIPRSYKVVDYENGNDFLADEYPRIELDRTTHKLFVVDENFQSQVSFFYSQNGEFIANKDLNDHDWQNICFNFGFSFSHNWTFTSNNSLPFIFDENFQTISEWHLKNSYNRLEGFTPLATILNDGDFMLIRGYSGEIPQIAVYDTSIEKYIGLFEFNASNIAINIGGGKYLISGREGFYNAIINVNGLTPLAGNISNDEYYDQAITGDGFIFLMNKVEKTIRVLDEKTQQPIETLKLLTFPQSMDYHNGRLVVAMGNVKHFVVFNTKNWSYEIIQGKGQYSQAVPVYHVSIYNDLVYYCDVPYYNSYGYIHEYNILSKNTKIINEWPFHWSRIYVCKTTCKLFVGHDGFLGMKISLYENNEFNEIVKQIGGYWGYSILRFDGTYIHAYGFMFDPETGIGLFKQPICRVFPCKRL